MDNNKIEIYKSGTSHEIKVQFDGDTVWLTQAQIGELFASSKANISEHIKKIFVSGRRCRDIFNSLKKHVENCKFVLGLS